jgi:hypothetical protein
MRKRMRQGWDRRMCRAHLFILLATALCVSAPHPGAAQVSAPIAATSQKAPTDAERARQIAALLRAAIIKCWTIDAGQSPAASTQVTVEFELRPSGALSRKPRIATQRGIPTNVALAASAIRAIEACAPYNNLPPELFETGWRHVRLTFDASTPR